MTVERIAPAICYSVMISAICLVVCDTLAVMLHAVEGWNGIGYIMARSRGA